MHWAIYFTLIQGVQISHPIAGSDAFCQERRGQTTFRNFMELAFSLDDLFCRRAALVAGAQPAPPAVCQKGRSSGVKRDDLLHHHILEDTIFLREIGRL
jgi:hypothetical protein